MPLPKRILIIHNAYQQPGGEDNVVKSEAALLQAHGHEVELHIRDNKEISSISSRLKAALNCTYSFDSHEKLSIFITKYRPDIMHVHNFFPLFSPSIFYAAHHLKVPTVMTLHNYRLICPGALLFRNGKICEKCVTGSTYRCVLYACYRKSHFHTLPVAYMVHYHHRKKTWQKKVDRFIALTRFSKQKFSEGGLPPDKILIKPNFHEARNVGVKGKRSGALFVGRLSDEKGIELLLTAWKQLDIPLYIAGSGPMLNKMRGDTKDGKISLLGSISQNRVEKEMKKAKFLIASSNCYEGAFPLVMIEAFANGLPVVAPRIGSIAEGLEEHVTGLLFKPGDPDDLARKVRWMEAHPNESRIMGMNARQIYEKKYTPEINYSMMMDAYDGATEESKRAHESRFC